MNETVETLGDHIHSPVFIDFEASSLRRGSYPIEIGVSFIGLKDFETVSKLIRPAQHWVMSSWSLKSQEVHGVSRDELQQLGEDPTEVARWFIEFVGERPLISDAPSYDQRWLDILLKTVGKDRSFKLIDFDAHAATVGIEKLKKIYGELDRGDIPHRAGPDAERLCRAWAIGTDHAILKRKTNKENFK